MSQKSAVARVQAKTKFSPNSNALRAAQRPVFRTYSHARARLFGNRSLSNVNPPFLPFSFIHFPCPPAGVQQRHKK